MDGENIQTIVDGDQVLVSGGVEAADCGYEADDGGDIDADWTSNVRISMIP
jgi:hypothetical protein